MNLVHSHLDRTNSTKAKELPIPAQSPKDEQANLINFTKEKSCLFLLGRLKNQQANSTKFAKARELPIPARSPKGPASKFYKIHSGRRVAYSCSVA